MPGDERLAEEVVDALADLADDRVFPKILMEDTAGVAHHLVGVSIGTERC